MSCTRANFCKFSTFFVFATWFYFDFLMFYLNTAYCYIFIHEIGFNLVFLKLRQILTCRHDDVIWRSWRRTRDEWRKHNPVNALTLFEHVQFQFVELTHYLKDFFTQNIHNIYSTAYHLTLDTLLQLNRICCNTINTIQGWKC